MHLRHVIVPLFPLKGEYVIHAGSEGAAPSRAGRQDRPGYHRAQAQPQAAITWEVVQIRQEREALGPGKVKRGCFVAIPLHLQQVSGLEQVLYAAEPWFRRRYSVEVDSLAFSGHEDVGESNSRPNSWRPIAACPIDGGSRSDGRRSAIVEKGAGSSYPISSFLAQVAPVKVD